MKNQEQIQEIKDKIQECNATIEELNLTLYDLEKEGVDFKHPPIVAECIGDIETKQQFHLIPAALKTLNERLENNTLPDEDIELLPKLQQLYDDEVKSNKKTNDILSGIFIVLAFVLGIWAFTLGNDFWGWASLVFFGSCGIMSLCRSPDPVDEHNRMQAKAAKRELERKKARRVRYYVEEDTLGTAVTKTTVQLGGAFAIGYLAGKKFKT